MGITAVAGVIQGTGAASASVSGTILICTDIRTTILRIRITRRIHTARMDIRIRPIRRRNITNILTLHPRPVLKMSTRRRRRTAI
jgi:hypothetical protein